MKATFFNGKWVLYGLAFSSLIFMSCINREPQQKTSRATKETSAKGEAFRLTKTIALPSDVNGRIDHLSMDTKGRRLFIAALGDKSVLVLDLKTGKVTHRIAPLPYPQGVLFVPGLNKLFVSTDGDGKVRIYNGQTFKLQNIIAFGDDADNLRYDAKRKLVYVGYGSGGIGVINAANNQLEGKIILPAHAEAFAFDPNGPLLYVNVPDADQMDIIDRNTFKVIERKYFGVFMGNFPMALDTKNHRLFIGFRFPPELRIYNTQTNGLEGSVKISGDVDDVFYNPEKDEVYASCGGGYVEIIRKKSGGGYAIEEKIRAQEGARTSLFVPEKSVFFLAAPKSGKNPAQIFVYRVSG